MSSQFVSCSSTRPVRARLFSALACAALLFAATAPAHAQFGAPPPGMQVKDASALKPPVGARVAIVEFADLECPACANANPLLREAAAKYKIPWVRHDFLIPSHAWSMSAAVNARWFDTKSPALGNEFRDQVFANQPYIYNLGMLREFTQKFAQSHSIALPPSIDPQGKLTAAVQSDNELGKRTGIHETPTIFVVAANSKGAPYIHVTDQGQLGQIVAQALADTAPAHPAAAKKKSTR
jgi:protein-disulfide isomerase